MTADEIVAWLAERKASEHDLAGMARYGIRVECAFGVKQPELRALAKRIGRDHRLAGELWSAGWRETRLLAAMIDEPQRVTRTQMDRWAGDFDSWDGATASVSTSFGARRTRGRRRARGPARSAASCAAPGSC